MTKRIIFLLLLLFITPLFIKLFAQETGKKEGKKETFHKFLRITPAILDINLTPGINQQFEFTIDNIADFPLGLKVSIEGFEASDETNGISFSSYSSTPLASWSSLSANEAILREHSSKKIVLSIHPPQNAEKKGYYGVLFFTPFITKPLDPSSPKVVSKIGALILATIGNQKTDDLSKKVLFQEFSFGRLYENGPFHALLRVENKYFTHFSAKPFITLIPLLGQAKTMELEEKRILPGKTRKWEAEFQSVPGWNPFYKAKLALSIGEGEQLMSETYFFVVPVKKILFVIALILFIFAFIKRRRQIKQAFFILIGKQR